MNMKRKVPVIAISGLKNVGKTTFIESLLPLLAAKGLRVAVFKHDGHRFAADREGTDTCRMLEAGAYGAAIFDGEKFQAVKYAAVTEEDLIALYPEADLILLEGFKWTSYPKIELLRKGVSEESLCDPATLLALVADMEPAPDGSFPDIPVFGFDETDVLADLLAGLCKE